jgi:hypothetical protein
MSPNLLRLKLLGQFIKAFSLPLAGDEGKYVHLEARKINCALNFLSNERLNYNVGKKCH